MKVFILSILILGLCGAVGAAMEWTTEENCRQWDVDTCIRDDPRMYIDFPIDTVRIYCCTVFVPCTVWVSPRLSDAFWLQAEKTWDEEFDDAWKRAWRRMKGYR